MEFDQIKQFVITFVSAGVIPIVAEEIVRGEDNINPDELEVAVRVTQAEVKQFFDSIETYDALQLCIPNLPGRNYLKLRLRQHVLFARLEQLRVIPFDSAIAVTSSPISESANEQVPLLEHLAAHFGLSSAELDVILDLTQSHEDHHA